MLYPPEGLCGAEPERGPIVFTLHFIGVGRGTGVSKSALVFDGMGWTDGAGWTGRVDVSDGISKVSFKFLHTLWIYRLCICLLIYEIKIVTNILMGLKTSCQVGGRDKKFQIYSR